MRQRGDTAGYSSSLPQELGSPSAPRLSPVPADGFGIHKNNARSGWEQKRGEQAPSSMTEVTFRLP